MYPDGYKSDPPREQFIFLWSEDRTSFSFKSESESELTPSPIFCTWLLWPFYPVLVAELRSYDNTKIAISLKCGTLLDMEFYNEEDTKALVHELELFYGVICH